MQSVPTFSFQQQRDGRNQYHINFLSSTTSTRHLQNFYCNFYHHLPVALHEMLGSVGSNPSASTTSCELPTPEAAAVSSPGGISPAISPAISSPALQQSYGYVDHSISAGGLMQLRDLLLETAQFISQCDWDHARPLLQVLSRRVSSTGDSTERVASCFFEALATRFSRVSGTEVNLS